MIRQGARLLYIDDDDGLRRLAERSLTRRGYRLTLAASGAEGIALAGSQPFDLIAVDHYMPGMDGLETLKRLRALPDPPPVVYVTGSEEGQIAIAALKAGAADYVVKTVGTDFVELLDEALKNVLVKRAVEEQLRASNARLEALLREVNHRVANSLQLVSAFVQLQSAAIADGPARAALEDTQRRIAAIGQVHRRLYTSNDVEGVEMADYLQSLVDELGQTWSAGSQRRILVDAEPLRLPTDRAVSVGVIVNELVSNACKYAYDESCGGEIRVALRRDGEDRFTLAVEDDGVGMQPDAPVRGTGLGTRLVRAMAQSLQSTIEYGASGGGGLRATLAASLT